MSLSKDPVLGECMSGCGRVQILRNTGGFKTGNDDVLVLIFAGSTAADGQTVNLAYSNDRGQTWTRYSGNPVLRRAKDYNKDFRDPKVFWYASAKKWILVLPAATPRRAISSNPRTSRTGRSWPAVPSGECPEMFELPVEGRTGQTKWVVRGGRLSRRRPTAWASSTF